MSAVFLYYGDRLGISLHLALLSFGRPSYPVRKNLDDGSKSGQSKDKDNRPSERFGKVKEDDEEAEPQSRAPRAVQKCTEGVSKGIFAGANKPVADELRDDVIREEAHQAEGRQCYQDQIANRNVVENKIVRHEPRRTKEDHRGEKQ